MKRLKLLFLLFLMAPGFADADEPYELSVELPACEASSPGVKIIQNATDWAAINNPSFSVFCVRPGDYRGRGPIELTASGTSNQPRVLRYYDPLRPVRALHPVHMAHSEQARINKLRFKGADHWIVDGLAILNIDPDISPGNRSVDLSPGSSNNVLLDLLVEGGRAGVAIRGESHRNQLQGSVVRETLITYGDSNCISIEAGDYAYGEIRDNRIVSNEAYDCTDSLQIEVRDPGVGTIFPGTVVANNDFYLTPARYTNCYGTFTPSGACAAAEGRFDIKAGGSSDTPSGRVLVTRNRIWGARKTDLTGLGGGGSWGSAIDACCYPSSYLLIEQNIIFGLARGIAIHLASQTMVRDNLIAAIHSPYDGQGAAYHSGGHSVGFIGNVVVGAVDYAVSGSNNVVACNAFVGLTQRPKTATSSSLLIGLNAYYGGLGPKLPAPTDLVFDSTSSSQHAERCFEARQITSPVTVCVPLGQPTAQSPLTCPSG